MVRSSTKKSPVAPAALPPRRLCRFCQPDVGCATEKHARGCKILCAACKLRAKTAAAFGLALFNYVYLYDTLCEGKCGVCNRTDSVRAEKSVHLNVDHIHKKGVPQRHAAFSGLIRGLLCDHCNRTVGISDLHVNRAYWLTLFTADHYDKARLAFLIFVKSNSDIHPSIHSSPTAFTCMEEQARRVYCSTLDGKLRLIHESLDSHNSPDVNLIFCMLSLSSNVTLNIGCRLRKALFRNANSNF